MLQEAAAPLAVPLVVMAERGDDAAAQVVPDVVLAAPGSRDGLRTLAGRCSVVTFEHELLDLDELRVLESDGVALRPGTGTLEVAVDKVAMRRRFERAGLPGPAYCDLSAAGTDGDRPVLERLAAFADASGWPMVLKAVRGGYDGRGVWVVADLDEAATVCTAAERAGTTLMAEEHVVVDRELAVLVARRPSGQLVAWPPVETAQVEGVCREVLVPGSLEAAEQRAAVELAAAVAVEAAAVGVLAVELFSCGSRLLVNEIAARPHNSGHWTIEGSVTSQFENHLRAVLDLPLGATEPTAPHVASVNVFGDELGDDPVARRPAALAVEGAHVHLYGKRSRPGRKLGHVTVCGDEAGSVRARAWAAARALGTPVPDELGVATGVA
jgi:5-(carboxyamino)imidazole ribonucleotide synthase